MFPKAKQNLSYVLLIGVVMIAASSFTALAQRPNRASDQQVEQLLRRIETHTNSFRHSLDDSLNRDRNSADRADELRDAVRDFEDAINRLNERFHNQRDTTSDAVDALNRADRVNNLIQGVRLTSRAESDWRQLRSDLDLLASYYNVNWRWSYTGASSPGSGGPFNGTWRLDPSRSDDINEVADRAVRDLSYDERQMVRRLIERRLKSPDTLAIEQRGRNFTIASMHAPQIAFDADGRPRDEYVSRRLVRVNASQSGDQLSVSMTGDRGNDYSATFDPIDRGQRLRVTRRVYTERLSQPAVATSIYNKVSDVAQLNLYTGPQGGAGGIGSSGSFVVPNGTQLVAELNNDLNTKAAREGDRFTLIVRSPGQYEGAVIEGVVTKVDRSGRLTGHPEMAFDFDRIRLRDGRTYDFKGYMESIRTPDGKNVRIDNEGSVKDAGSQTGRTVTRTGIGAAVGAVIGAIAGGGSGAAIGAAIGAGTGAGSVLIQGRDDLELSRGTQMMIVSSAPRAREARR
ncbi:MAG: hypothetical protein ACREBD_05075 [Blastocatellia bacterium]